MSNSQNYRKKKFMEELSTHLALLPRGSWRYRKIAKLTLQDLTNDLAYLGILPLRVRSLKTENMLALVKHWQNWRLAPKTIKNRLSILRRVLSTYEKPIPIPTNKELGVIVKKKPIMRIKPNNIDIHMLPLYPTFIVQEVCKLQYLFGLKLHEAMKLDSSMVHEKYLEVPRGISFNKKDRTVPISSIEQQEYLAKFRVTFNGLLPIIRDFHPCFIALHRYTAKILKLPHQDYFRECYIQRRYQELLRHHGEFEALGIVRVEVGYSRTDQLRGVLSCLENS